MVLTAMEPMKVFKVGFTQRKKHSSPVVISVGTVKPSFFFSNKYDPRYFIVNNQLAWWTMFQS